MSSTENTSGISEIIMKMLLFLGIFAVASDGGKNEYKFETGINLTIVLIIAIAAVTIMKIVEFHYLEIIKKGDN